MRALCMCSSCVSRRAAQKRWTDKNKAKRYAQNNAVRKRWRAKVKQSVAEVSDVELDRRALMMERLQDAR